MPPSGIHADYPPLLCSTSDKVVAEPDANPLRATNMHVICPWKETVIGSRVGKAAKTAALDQCQPFFGQTPNFVDVVSSVGNPAMYSARGYLNVVSHVRKSAGPEPPLATPSSGDEKSRTLLEWKARTEYLEHQLQVFMDGQRMFKGVPVDWGEAMDLVHGKVHALEQRMKELRASNVDIEKQVKAVMAENEELVRLKTKKGVMELQSTIASLRQENSALQRSNETLQAEAWELMQMMSQHGKQHYQAVAAKEAGGDKEKQSLIYTLANVRHSERRLMLQLETTRVENLRLGSLVCDYATKGAERLTASPVSDASTTTGATEDGWFDDALWSIPADGPYFFK